MSNFEPESIEQVEEALYEPQKVRTQPKPIKGLKKPEERKAFADKLTLMVMAGMEQVGRLSDRWERNEQLYRQEPIATGTEVSGQPRHVPIVQPRVDQLVANICGPLFANEPYYVAKGWGMDAGRSQEVESFVHFFNQRAQLDRRYRKGIRLAAKAEPAIVRVHFEDGHADHDTPDSDTKVQMKQAYVGPAISVIHPKNFVCYPLYVGDIAEAKVTGHRFARRVQEIRERQLSGIYFDAETIYGGEDPQEWNAGRSKEWSLTEEASGIVGETDQAVEVWELIVKEDLDGDGFEERYLVHLVPDQGFLLSCQRYGAEYEDGVCIPYSRPWYFELFIHESDDGELYRSNPFVQNLQGIQVTFNEIWNLIVDGSMMAATPAGFTNDRLLHGEFVKYQPGTIYHVDGPLNIVWAAPKFDPGVLPAVLDKLEMLADAASRISQAGIGQNMKAGTTATEAAGVLAGQQVGLDEYRTNAAMCGSQMCDFVRELSFLHFDNLVEAYGEQLPGANDLEGMRAKMEKPLIWEPNGKSGTNSPQQLIEKIQLVLQFAQIFGYNVAELGKVVLQALDLPVDIDRLMPQPMAPGGMNGMGVPGGVGGDVPQPGMGQPQGMVGGPQGQMPPDMGELGPVG